jgi:hypothetical protein
MASLEVEGLTPNENYIIKVFATYTDASGQVHISDVSLPLGISTPSYSATGGNLTTTNSGTDIQLSGGSLFAGTFPSGTGLLDVVNDTVNGTGVILNQSGIAGFNSGTKEFYLDAVGGTAYFAGTLSGTASIGSTTLSNVASQAQAGSSKNKTFYQSTQPTASLAGDLWYDTSNGYKMWRWDGTQWTSVQDTSIAAAKDAAIAAQSTADGKNKIYRQGTTPTGTFSVGDVWFNTSSDNAISRWDGSSWVATVLGDNALVSISANKITAGTIDASRITVSNLDAGNISTGYLSADRIASNTITAAKIAAGTITANEISSQYVYAGTIDAGKISAGTITGSDIVIAGDSNTNRFRTSYPRATPTLGYTVNGLGINAIAMISATYGGVSSNWYPYYDSDSSLGLTGQKWLTVYAHNGTIQTSDMRLKTNISTSDLGLDFINSLNPTKFTKIYKIAIPVFDENNQPIADENGNRVIDKYKTIYGERYHYGLLAQEVKSSLDKFGIGDTFAGWTLDDPNDPESRQGLSYEQFISPIIKAIKEMSTKINNLQSQLDSLTK